MPGLSRALEPAQGSKVAFGRLLLLPVTKKGLFFGPKKTRKTRDANAGLPSSPETFSKYDSKLLLFYFSLEGARQCQQDGTKRNPFARNEVRSPKTAVKLRFQVVPLVPRTLSHEMRLRLCVKAFARKTVCV